MNDLKSIQDQATKAYSEATPDGRKALIAVFGESFFNKDVFSYTTFAEVSAAAGKKESDYNVPDCASYKEKVDMYIKRLDLIGEVYNGDWIANLADTSQQKWWVWYDIKKNADKLSGFGLVFSGTVYTNSFTGVGSRHYYKDDKTARYVGRTFLIENENLANYENLLRMSKNK